MYQATTIVAVCREGSTAIAGDGQVTLGQSIIMKNNASKVRQLYNGQVIAGFAGAVADAFTLFDKFEDRLKEYHGNLVRAAVEVSREWRTDKILRRLEAQLIVANSEKIIILSGNGELIEPDDGVSAIGSGGPYALAAARALCRHTDMPAETIAREALKVAAGICVYTNDNINVETVASK